jgi:hypothetical protein
MNSATALHRYQRLTAHNRSRLLDDCGRAGVWPDSVQVLGGMLYSRLPTCSWVWLYSGLRIAGHRGVVWLKRGVPSSQ